MQNPKTAPFSSPKPVAQSGWVRKSALDAYLDRCLPIPTQVVSNEEYLPIRQTREQRAVERRLEETARHNARLLGMNRRQFLRSSCGMAAAFAAMNSVFGHFFDVDAAELLEPAAQKPNPYFIFDVQTHHVATPEQMPGADQEFLRVLLGLRRLGAQANPELAKRDPVMEDLYLMNYIKEVFLDSETHLAVVSALPSATEEGSVLPPEVIVKTRDWVNELARSQRIVTHGYFSPDQGTRNLESMHAQAEKMKIEAWKGYTGTSRVRGRMGWALDDEKEAYPALEYARKSGVKNVCLHKGLPLSTHNEEWWHPRDIMKAAVDFPTLNFLVYHSGFKSIEEALPAARDSFQKTSNVPWVSDLCAWKKKNPQVKNVYMELGSTFGLMVATSPLLCAHVLGTILDAFGPDHVLWGTDSIWWGSPQWQIEAFRRLEMPESLMKQFGHQPFTPEVKQKIFGLNAARVYGVDPQARRNPIPGDYVDKLRARYKQSALAAPSNTQYGWVHAV